MYVCVCDVCVLACVCMFMCVGVGMLMSQHVRGGKGQLGCHFHPPPLFATACARLAGLKLPRGSFPLTQERWD